MSLIDARPAGIPTSRSEVAAGTPPLGLSSSDAEARLAAVGLNEVPDTAVRPLRAALAKFWAPVPWMLEAAVVLEFGLGKYVEAAVIACLLVFNAAIGLFQEGRAQATLQALKSKLALTATVRRAGAWVVVPATRLVPGDVVKLSLGGVVAADVRLLSGEVLLDQSMLTGESVPIEAGAGADTFAGALVRRGEAVAEVTATGARTRFGRTAELVRTAHVVSSQQTAVLRVVRNLAVFNGLLVLVLIGYARILDMPPAEIVPLVLTAILGSIPVALPATFTLASALGARALAAQGVLPTRLSAVDEAATMSVLCVDKTGTLTRNALTVASVYPEAIAEAQHVLHLAALASSDGGQDPVDAAIREAAKGGSANERSEVTAFVPFDPATRMSEATVSAPDGTSRLVVKGAFATVARLAAASSDQRAAASRLEDEGYRVLAIATGPAGDLECVGLVALSDPPRPDSAALVSELAALGVRTVMVTGDAVATATTVAGAVGLKGAVCPPGPIPAGVRPDAFAIYAGVLPQDKFALVEAFQEAGSTVGMCGDGANDAPALRQAQIGIAVSTATDVAKSAAGMVLTKPGLVGVVAAVKEGRTIFQRIQTYTLNSIVKKLVTVAFMAVGLVMTGHPILTPMLMVIVMVTGDFLAMSLTTDDVRPSQVPNAWRIGDLTKAGALIGVGLLAFCVGLVALGKFEVGLETGALQSLAFLALVFGGQATIYAIRGRRGLWGTRPSGWLLVSSMADVAIASSLAIVGIAMSPLPIVVVASVLAAAAMFALLLAFVKLAVFERFDIA